MTIPYSITKSPFSKNGFIARIKSIGTANLETLADRMVNRGTTVTRSDILAVLNLLIEVCLDMILEGWRIDLGGLVRIYCTIEGKFEEQNDRFERSRHTLKGSAQAGKRLNKALDAHGKPRKKQSRTNTATITHFTDLNSSSRTHLTPGGQATIQGGKLKIDPTAEDEGVFLISQNNQVYPLELGYNTSKLLLFNIPNLPPGQYTLEIRNRPKSNIRSLRDIRLGYQLIVD